MGKRLDPNKNQIYLKPSPNEEVKLLQNERHKLRKLRLKQVREQEKVLATRIRRRFKEKEQRELNLLGNELKKKWDDNTKQKRHALETLYLENVARVGEGHQAALLQEDDGDPKAISLEDEAKTAQRYREALKKLKEDEAERAHLQSEKIESRCKALEVERIRAARIAALDPPVPDIADHLEMIQKRKYKKKNTDEYSSTYYHLPQKLVEKADSDEDQVDARDAAKEEEERMQTAQENAERNFSEQMEKARLRHKHARSQLLLQKDHDKLLEELEHFERIDRQRRQDIVSKIPKHIFEPPHRRMEANEERQREIEHAFEDMYMAQTNYVGDVGLAREPLSTSPSTADDSADASFGKEDKVASLHRPEMRSEIEPSREVISDDGDQGIEHVMTPNPLPSHGKKRFVEEAEKSRTEIKPATNDPLKRLLKKIDQQRDRWRSNKIRMLHEDDHDHGENHDAETVISDVESAFSEGTLTVTSDNAQSVASDRHVGPTKALLHPYEEARRTRAAASHAGVRGFEDPRLADVEKQKQLLQQQKLKLQLQQQEVLKEHLQLQSDIVRKGTGIKEADGKTEKESSLTKLKDFPRVVEEGMQENDGKDSRSSSALGSFSSGLLTEDGKPVIPTEPDNNEGTSYADEILSTSSQSTDSSVQPEGLGRHEVLPSIPESVFEDDFVALTPVPPSGLVLGHLPQPQPLRIEMSTAKPSFRSVSPRTTTCETSWETRLGREPEIVRMNENAVSSIVPPPVLLRSHPHRYSSSQDDDDDASPAVMVTRYHPPASAAPALGRSMKSPTSVHTFLSSSDTIQQQQDSQIHAVPSPSVPCSLELPAPAASGFRSSDLTTLQLNQRFHRVALPTDPSLKLLGSALGKVPPSGVERQPNQGIRRVEFSADPSFNLPTSTINTFPSSGASVEKQHPASNSSDSPSAGETVKLQQDFQGSHSPFGFSLNLPTSAPDAFLSPGVTLAQEQGFQMTDPSANVSVNIPPSAASAFSSGRPFEFPPGNDTASYLQFYQQQLVEQQERIREQQRAIQERQQQRLEQLKQFQERLRAQRTGFGKRFAHDIRGTQRRLEPSTHWQPLIPMSQTGQAESSSGSDTQSNANAKSTAGNIAFQTHENGSAARIFSKTLSEVAASDGEEATSSSLSPYPSDIVPPRRSDERILFPDPSELGLWSDSTVQLSLSDATKSSSAITIGESSHGTTSKEQSSTSTRPGSEVSSLSLSNTNGRSSSTLNRSSESSSKKSKNSIESDQLLSSSLAKSGKPELESLSSSASDSNNNLLLRMESSLNQFQEMIEEAKTLNGKYLDTSGQPSDSVEDSNSKEDGIRNDSGDLRTSTIEMLPQGHEEESHDAGPDDTLAGGTLQNDTASDDLSHLIVQEAEQNHEKLKMFQPEHETINNVLETTQDIDRSAGQGAFTENRSPETIKVNLLSGHHENDDVLTSSSRSFINKGDSHFVLPTGSGSKASNITETEQRSFEIYPDISGRPLSVIPEESVISDDGMSEGQIEGDEPISDELKQLYPSEPVAGCRKTFEGYNAPGDGSEDSSEKHELKNLSPSTAVPTSETPVDPESRTGLPSIDNRTSMVTSGYSDSTAEVVFSGLSSFSLSADDSADEPNGSNKPSLQEAFMRSRQRFVKDSQQRVREAKEARFRPPKSRDSYKSGQKPEKNHREANWGDNNFPSPETRLVTKSDDLAEGKTSFDVKRKIGKQDMMARTKRLYQNLPDVREREAEKQREQIYAANRAKAQEFQKQTRERLRKLNEKKTGKKK